MKKKSLNISEDTKWKRYYEKIFSQYLHARTQLEHVTPQMLEIFSDGKPPILRAVAEGLSKISPAHPDLPLIYSAIHKLERSKKREANSIGPGKGLAPVFSLPLGEVPSAYLDRIQSSHHGERSKKNLTYELREILGAAQRAGLAKTLNRESLAAFRAELEGRNLSAQTILGKMKNCTQLALIWDLDPETMKLITNERRAAKTKADQVPSARYVAFRAAPLTPLDYAQIARSVSEEAYRCKGSRQSIHRLFVTAAALALLSFLPERVSDIRKLVVGRNITRDARGWSSHYLSDKTSVDRTVDYLPAQLTPYLDDLILLGADPGPHGRDLMRIYQHRVAQSAPLFARINLRTPYSQGRIWELVKERTGHGSHAARKAMTDYLVEIGESRLEIMDLLGHRRSSTSQRHYEVHAAAIRRKRTTEAVDHLRTDLVKEREFRLPNGKLINLSNIGNDLDKIV